MGLHGEDPAEHHPPDGSSGSNRRRVIRNIALLFVALLLTTLLFEARDNCLHKEGFEWQFVPPMCWDAEG